MACIVLLDNTVLEHWFSKYCLSIRITWQAFKIIGPHLRYPELEFQKVGSCTYVLIELPRWFWCLICPLRTTNQIPPIIYRVEMDYWNTSIVFISVCSLRACPGWNSCSASFISDSNFSIVWNSGSWPMLKGRIVAGFTWSFQLFENWSFGTFPRVLCPCQVMILVSSECLRWFLLLLFYSKGKLWDKS